MAFKKILISPGCRSTVYRTQIPAILHVLYRELGYELDAELYRKYVSTMDEVGRAERAHILHELRDLLGDALIGIGTVKIHDVVSVFDVHYRIYWSE